MNADSYNDDTPDVDGDGYQMAERKDYTGAKVEKMEKDLLI